MCSNTFDHNIIIICLYNSHIINYLLRPHFVVEMLFNRNLRKNERRDVFHAKTNTNIILFLRVFFAGVTPLEILFSHVITQFVVMCGQTALVLIFMILVFGVECKGDITLVIALTILQGLCGMCFGE